MQYMVLFLPDPKLPGPGISGGKGIGTTHYFLSDPLAKLLLPVPMT